ncbi:response regulator [Flavobacterium sp. J49]|uniref:response regulator n=1 Tax=Flavobacterium sp. J49 TaxID=2718534 RepID=UPI001592F8CE|nr:response regulator [Flavobacterium sp. J49]MBF6641986.1 response regulator [Flavobacterium sp. J49]NIC03234.1 response regulator [Flavobacterium sp. J49]
MKKIELLALVDDDDTFVFITKRIIEKTNHVKEIKVFGNGLDALNYLKENLNSEYKLPDVIFLDLSMPIMDGWQFLDEFTSLESQKTSKIIIYVCSSSISPHDIMKAKKMSAVSDFIIKPVTKDKFSEIILTL